MPHPGVPRDWFRNRDGMGSGRVEARFSLASERPPPRGAGTRSPRPAWAQ